MTVRTRWPLLVLAFGLAALPAPAGAQATSPRTMPAAETPAPGRVTSFTTPPEILRGELTLEEAVTIALENAPKITARVGDFAAAQQRVAQALAPLLPQLSGQWNGFQNQNVSTSSGFSSPGIGPSQQRTVTTQFLTTTATVTASQLLFDFGKNWAARDAAKSNADVFREAIELQKEDIVRDVKVFYFTLLLAKRLVAVNIAALDRADLNLKTARGFFEVGTRPKSEVTRAEVDVANGRVNVIRAQNAVSQSRVALNTAMGIAVSSPTEVRDTLAYEQFPLDRDTLLTEALQRRPEYKQAKAQADASGATVRQTFRQFFPDIVASGTYGAARADMNEIYNYGVQLTWSIFDGGGKIARYKEAKANLDAALARVRDTELSIWQDVEQAYLSVVENEARIGAAGKAVESAEENFRLSQGRFDAGVANIIELTDAQLALTQAQSQEAQALADYKIAIARLERSLGRR